MSRLEYILKVVFLNFIAILLGFFLAINLSTILGQSGDWGVLSAGLITAVLEATSRILYKTKKKLIF
jgi:positive regulator of sigma E activity